MQGFQQQAVKEPPTKVFVTEGGKKPELSDKAQEAKLLTEKIPFLYSHFYETCHSPKVIYLTVSGSS